MATTVPSAPTLIRARRFHADGAFRGVTMAAGVLVFALLAAITVFLVVKALPAFAHDKSSFWTTQIWDPDGSGKFGIAALVFGTLLTSVLGLIISVPVALGVSLFITEYAPARLSRLLGYTTDMLAAVPSVVYGLWGLFFLLPHLVGVQRFLATYFGWIPLFRGQRRRRQHVQQVRVRGLRRAQLRQRAVQPHRGQADRKRRVWRSATDGTRAICPGVRCRTGSGRHNRLVAAALAVLQRPKHPVGDTIDASSETIRRRSRRAECRCSSPSGQSVQPIRRATRRHGMCDQPSVCRGCYLAYEGLVLSVNGGRYCRRVALRAGDAVDMAAVRTRPRVARSRRARAGVSAGCVARASPRAPSCIRRSHRPTAPRPGRTVARGVRVRSSHHLRAAVSGRTVTTL